MKPDVEEKLVDMLNWVEGALKTGSDFMVEQTPLYIQELLAYNFWISLVWFILSLVVFIGCIFGGYRCKKCKNPDEELFFVIMILSVPLFISTFGMYENTDWFKIKVAPRVYVVDYLRTELKK